MKIFRAAAFCLVFFFASFIPLLSLAAEGQIQVVIDGIEGDEFANVRTALAIPPGLVSRDGVVDTRWLKNFERQAPRKAREALQPFGFYDPLVTVSSEKSQDGLHKIRISIDPREPVRVTGLSVRVEGPGSDERRIAEIIRAFPLNVGDVLRQDKYENAKKEIRSKAVELGYLNADFSTHVIRLSPPELRAEIDLVLETGPLYYFGQVNFSGASLYPSSFFGRYLAFKAGDVFSHLKIGQTQRNLINADRFSEVVIHADQEAASDHRVPVGIKLTPSKPKRLRMGIGFETDIGVKGTVKYRDVNFLRTSHEFESAMDISENLKVLGLRYVMPDHKDIGGFTSLGFSARREDHRAFFTETMTAEWERTRTIGRNMTGSAFLQLMHERSDAGDEETNTFSLLPGFRLSAISYDNMVRPTRGYRYSMEFKGTHQTLGSHIGLAQVVADGGLVIPLPARFTLLTRARIGSTTLNDATVELPIALRFFAGGDQSVRGYRYKSLGPQDANGDVVGGKNLLVGSIELERAIGENWGLALFYDTGNAFNNFSDISLAQGAGAGIRYYSPIGPFKLDVARQMDEKNSDFRIHLSVGFNL
ncbi:MAG TPA: autotransporter assembly complex family protein [Syntrophorhabdaceae bacterium]|nr:autotransporter assembly complex family protein [Syntrophorhabdaceae bacterium]HQM80248.1 autotransporter assembly complex family protein [Syntrophorhabdaceae bacterium]